MPDVPAPRPARIRRGDARPALLDAALSVFRAQGYAGTSVDDLCRAAGVTKGAFFHHFASKEALAVAAADHFGRMADGLFAQAPFRALPRAADRVLGYVALRCALMQGPIESWTCYAGTLTQEVWASHPAIREAAAAEILGHAERLEPDFARALADAGEDPAEAASLSRHVQAVLQGAFVLAKAAGDAAPARESAAHLLAYLAGRFGTSVPEIPPAPFQGGTSLPSRPFRG
ncbi:MAG: TetR/AcrR family transcriptional regulator [Albimonas sp.]|uniref:TetR/AcrR family transcriptional regulator n=1 Tax=Albimonas sp. TaxID=1872425 RepID=UPI004056478D|tara:strand:- start:879 stop:1571 length:693 start_codon:yes stop_codon:yes gene_type:complete